MERGTLFTPFMADQIRTERKLMTRRIAHDIPVFEHNGKDIMDWPLSAVYKHDGEWFVKVQTDVDDWTTRKLKAFAQVGDVLYVKEGHYRFGQWKKNGLTKKGRQRWRFNPEWPEPNFRFLDDKPFKVEKNTHRLLGWYKRSPLFMPKKFARIWLDVIDVQIERVRDITEEDAINEGSIPPGGSIIGNKKGALGFFEELWKSINGSESWDKNAWVWVITFIKKPA